MRLKQSSRNSARSVLFSKSAAIILSLVVAGCSPEIKPTYKEKDIPYIIKKICKEEYKLDVTTYRTNNTLWIYAPVEKILHDEYGLKQDKYFDESLNNKLRNILTTTGRVLISSDNAPEFYALVASDINVGIDYTLIGNVLDMKKSYANFIPWTEANRRYVFRLKAAPESIGDKTGFHIVETDIELPDFLAEQIAQRISGRFAEEGLGKNFKVEKVEGKFKNRIFYFDYSIQQTGSPKEYVDIRQEILKIIAYCLLTYDFKDFSGIALKDVRTQDVFDFLSPTALKLIKQP
jgi:hypothetical protein